MLQWLPQLAKRQKLNYFIMGVTGWLVRSLGATKTRANGGNYTPVCSEELRESIWRGGGVEWALLSVAWKSFIDLKDKQQHIHKIVA